MRTKINERNAANVMGKINNFFKGDVKEDLGIRDVQVGTNNIYDSYGYLLWERPVFEKQRVLVSYSGKCDVHYLRKEFLRKIKNNERIFSRLGAECLLSISTPYDTDCIPLSIGDIVELKGNKLTVKHAYIPGCYSKRTFVKASISKGEKAAEIKRGLHKNLMWFCDDTMWAEIAAEEFRFNMLEVHAINREIERAFSDMIEKINFSNPSGHFSKVINMKEISNDIFVYNNDFSFEISINLDAVGKDSNDIFNIELDGRNVDTFGVICKAFNEN